MNAIDVRIELGARLDRPMLVAGAVKGDGLSEGAKECQAAAASHSGDATCDCGKSFWPPRVDARFCSKACRQKAYREPQSVKMKAGDGPIATAAWKWGREPV
jgi:hypothetical protein